MVASDKGYKMFFKKDQGLQKGDGYGRLYVLRFELDSGIVLHKVGMCKSNRTLDRMMEILRSFFTIYRYVPRVTLRKDMKTIVPLLVEKHMHNLLDEWSYRFEKNFDGSTEFFQDLDESVLLDYLSNFDYTELLKVDEMKTEDYEAIKEEIKKNNTNKEEGINELPF